MKKILIIEDDATLLRSLKDNFDHRGFEVTTASEGTQARKLALQDQCDLILLDIMLPMVNGYEICHAVRQSEIMTPIIMLTAKGHEEDIIRGLELGADDYVTKPFSIGELVARVNAILRRSNDDRKVVRFANCELNIEARMLRRNGRPIELTAKEFGLLELFVRRPSRALTRNEILNHVWGRSVAVTRRSVDRCVTTLRAKIEDDPARPELIHTVRDIGYRFEDHG